MCQQTYWIMVPLWCNQFSPKSLQETLHSSPVRDELWGVFWEFKIWYMFCCCIAVCNIMIIRGYPAKRALSAMMCRALLAGYPRIASRYNSTQLYLFGTKPFSQISSEWLSSRKKTSLKLDSLIFLKNAFQKQNVNKFFCGEANVLTHWGHEKIAAILQMTFSNTHLLLWKCLCFNSKVHWNLFLRVQ